MGPCSVMVHNCPTMHKLIDWFNNYVKQHDMKDLWWRMDPVTNPNLMRIEHILGFKNQSDRPHYLKLLNKTHVKLLEKV